MANKHNEAVKRYQQRSGKQYLIWVRSVSDADIIARLDAQDNKQGYIKSLIRADIAREGMADSKTKVAAYRHGNNARQYHMWMHSANDADIIRKLDAQSNRQGYLKALIRADIAREGREK